MWPGGDASVFYHDGAKGVSGGLKAKLDPNSINQHSVFALPYFDVLRPLIVKSGYLLINWGTNSLSQYLK